ncbi:MAG: hypothetical protein F4X18_03945 [Acidimicrobiia bacterium]|nr:hypothetical protein [Acidimicrobiia bacterium]
MPTVESLRLEPELVDHLRREFGPHGCRAVEFLQTAQCLLEAEPVAVSKLGELVAYCIREALTEIPKASGTPDDRRWKELSREVVEARKRYRIAPEFEDESRAEALDELLSAIDRLAEFHRRDPEVHRGRLIALMIQRAGVEPLSSGTDPVVAYQTLLECVASALHGSCTVADACEYWWESVALLRQLFLPAELRHPELGELARLDTPSDSDLVTVLRLAGTPIHLQRFLREVTSPRWLWLLEGSGVLNSGGNELWWSAGSAAVRLADTHRDKMLCWITAMYDRHGNVLERARAIAHTAYRLDGSALGVLLTIVRRYPDDDRVALSGVRAALELDASDRVVEDLADVLMNEATWDRVIVAERLVSHLADGVDEENGLRRIELLCFKLKKVTDDDLVLGLLRDPQGSIAEGHSLFPHDRSSVLLGCLTTAVRSAWDWLPASDLLDHTSSLPDPLKGRLRAWILACAPHVDPGAIMAELAQAITSRDATGDDIALIDRAIQVCDHTVLVNGCRIALGDAPTDAEVRRVLGSRQPLPRSWMRAETWAALLPADLIESWQTLCRLLAARYGELRREDLLRRDPVRAVRVGSPINAEELGSIPPDQAAERVARWRPEPGDWNVSALELARTLRALVKEDPSAWVSEPEHIVRKLRHPLYINHYLQAAAELAADMPLPVADLLDVVQLVRSEPWPVVPLSRGRLEQDHGWQGAHRSSVTLIDEWIKAEVDFGDRTDEVWAIIESAARDPSDPSWGSDDRDPMSRAINRSRTRAFETTIRFVAAELRASRPVRPAFENLLEFGLRLGGGDGAEYRAILAPRIAWLRHVMTEWTDANLDLLFGALAPDGLAQTTIDLAIQWSQPNRWLLETYPEMIQDAVTRRVGRAMSHLLVGMLWELSAYRVEAVVGFLVAELETDPDDEAEPHPTLVSGAGMDLSTLIRDDETDQRYVGVAVALWEALLESEVTSSLEGFGWMSTATALDTDHWAELTLATLGKTGRRISWEHQVAERAMSQPVTTTKLDLLDQLIRGQDEHWVLRHIADQIDDYLASATNLEATDEYQKLLTALLERGLIDT